MMPEQVWDTTALPEHGLFPGGPTGSAMPLAWTHAEFIKLMVSRHLGFPVDRPSEVWRRYGGRRPSIKQAVWCPHAAIGRIDRGVDLLIALPQSAVVRWGRDGWQASRDLETRDTGLGLHVVELDAAALAEVQRIDFTVQWRDTGKWVGTDFQIEVED
jgi:glucoamylase